MCLSWEALSGLLQPVVNPSLAFNCVLTLQVPRAEQTWATQTCSHLLRVSFLSGWTRPEQGRHATLQTWQ